jgi:hypothetical protein
MYGPGPNTLETLMQAASFSRSAAGLRGPGAEHLLTFCGGAQAFKAVLVLLVNFERFWRARDLPLKRKISLQFKTREEKCDGEQSVQKMH